MYQFPRWERGFKSISLLIEIVVFLFEKQKKKKDFVLQQLPLNLDRKNQEKI